MPVEGQKSVQRKRQRSLAAADMLGGGGEGENGRGGACGRGSTVRGGFGEEVVDGGKGGGTRLVSGAGEVAMDKLGVSGGVNGGVSSPVAVGSRSGVCGCAYLTMIVGMGTSLLHPFLPVGIAWVMSSRSLCSSRSLTHAARLA